MTKQNSGPVRPWTTLSSKKALDEKWFPVRRDTIKLPSGRIIDDYFVWESPHIVQVVPVTADGKFVIVRQYRHAAGQVLHQFPAGGRDKGESIEQAAARELKEETGYTTKKLVHLATVNPFATKMSGPEDMFIALDVTLTEIPQLDDQEETEVVLMDRNELLGLLDDKHLQSATLFAGVAAAFRYLRLPLF